MRANLRAICACVLLLGNAQVTARTEDVSDAQILRRVGTLHLSVDAPEEIKERITRCFVDALQTIPIISFVHEYGYNPTVDSFAPHYAFHIVVTRVANPPKTDSRLAISTLIQEPFHSEQMFGILNRSTTTGAPLFSKDVLFTLNFMTSNLAKMKAHWLNISTEENISSVCRAIATEFDVTILERQREALRQRRSRGK
jgi:hypothetical protein